MKTLRRIKGFPLVILLFFLISTPAAAGPGYLGIIVENLSRPMRIALGIEHGILVTRVLGDSPASRAGLKEGDIITMIDNRRINSISDLIMEMKKERKGTLQITLISRGKKKELTVKPEQKRGTRFQWHHRFDHYGDSFEHPFFYEFHNDEVKKLKEEMKKLEKKLQQLYKELGKEYQ